MRWLAPLLLVGLLVACSTTQASTVDSECPFTACAGHAVPSAECADGVPSQKCKAHEGGECRWQIECLPPDPNAVPDAISPCDAAACGAEPAWDESECAWGFLGPGSCESFDRQACAWTRRCKPKPCSVAEGTCNTLDQGRLGGPCDADGRCPSGASCFTYALDVGNVVGPVCVAGNPCAPLTCAKGRRCGMTEGSPGQTISCG